MDLLSKTIKAEVPDFIKNDVRLTFIGSKENLNDKVIKIMQYGEEQTKDCKAINLQIAFNYGARAEIVHAVKNICKLVETGELKVEDINEETVSRNLYTKNVPNPDLLIRTGGEKRLSNYLLWQCAYSEIYVTETFWPDFDENEFQKAIEEYNNRQRRFGK